MIPGRCADDDRAIALPEKGAAWKKKGVIGVMAGRHYGDAGARQPADHLEASHLILEIQMRRGFVEHKDIGLLLESAGLQHGGAGAHRR